MGQTSSSGADRYTIGFNQKLNSQLIQNLEIKSSKNEVGKFKGFMNKKFKKEFTPSSLSNNLKTEGKAFTIAIGLIDIIYTKSIKHELLQRNNRNIYSIVFNYSTIPKESVEYERFNKRTLSSFEYVITGEAHNFNNSMCNSSFNSPNTKDKSYFFNSDSLLNKSKIIKLQSTNKNNDTSSDNEIMTSMLDLNSIKPTSTFRSNRIKKTNTNRKNNQAEDTETINLADESFNIFAITEERNYNDDSEHIIHFETQVSHQKSQLTEAKKKKHRALPTKAPLVNIKLKINDLVKQDIYENSVLEPFEKYKSPKENKLTQRRDKYKFNQTNAYHLNVSTNVNDLTVIKPDTSVANVNDNTSFLSIIDIFTQANKKRKDVIHSKTPAKSKVMRNPNYLKSAPSKSNEKIKKKVDIHSYKFNF